MHRIALKLIVCITVVLCLTASVYAAAGVSLAVGPPKIARPDDLITHVFTIKNTGTDADQYNLKLTLPPGWVALPIPDQVSLAAGETSQIFLTVIVPGRATAGIYAAVLRATSVRDPSVWAETEGVIKIVPTAALALEALQISHAPPGAEAKHVFRIRNIGNVVDTYRIDIRSDKDWTIRISQVEIQVLPGDRGEFVVTVLIPRAVAPGTRYFLWVEATSQVDANVTETLKLTARVAPPHPEVVRAELYPELPIVIRFHITDAGDPTFGLALAGNLPGIGRLKVTRHLGLLGVIGQRTGFYTPELGVEWGSVSVSGAFAGLSGEGLRFLWDDAEIGSAELLLTDVGKAFAVSWEWGMGILRLVSVGVETVPTYSVNELQFAGRLSESFSLAAIFAGASSADGSASAFRIRPRMWSDLMRGHIEFAAVSPRFPEEPESTTFEGGVSFGSSPLTGGFSTGRTIILTDPGPPQVFIATQRFQATGSFSPNNQLSLALIASLEEKESDDTPKTTQEGSSNLSLTFTGLINRINWSLVASSKQAWDDVAGTDFSTIRARLSARMRVGQTDISGTMHVEKIQDLITDTISETTSSFSLSLAFPRLFLAPTINLAASAGDASLSAELSWVDGTGLGFAASLRMPLNAGGGFSSTLEFTFPIMIPFFGPTYGIIRGQVFIDENKNGILDPGEEGVPGCLLLANGKEAITGTDGRFVFASLLPGHYSVKIAEMPFGLSPLRKLPLEKTLIAGQQVELLIPMESKSGISGVVFHDLDQDGRRDAGEPGVAGVILRIISEMVQKQVSTDEAGTFSLEVLPGIYTVELVAASLPARFEPTTPTQVQVLVEERAFPRVQFGAYQHPRPVIFVADPPIARFDYAPKPATVGERVTFDAAASQAVRGVIVSYHWEFRKGANVFQATGQRVSVIFEQAGTWLVTLRIIDSYGLEGRIHRPVFIW